VTYRGDEISREGDGGAEAPTRQRVRCCGS